MKINSKPIYFAIYYFQKEAIMFFMKSFWNENAIIQHPKMYTTTLDQQSSAQTFFNGTIPTVEISKY